MRKNARVHREKRHARFLLYTSRMTNAVRVFCAVASAIALLVALFFLFSLSTHVAQAADCPAGTTPITSGTRAAATAAGIPTSAECWDPKSTIVGQEKGEAKQYLNSIVRGGKCGPYQSSAEGLNPDFAVCAARFMKALRAKDPRFYVASMYRSSAHQAYLCGGGCGRVNGPCAAAGQSKHQSGNAIDISNGQRIVPEWVHNMARGYGIRFPVNGDSGHMEPIPGSNCSNPNFQPTDTVGDITPTTRLTDTIRKFFNPPPQPAPSTPSTSGSPTQSSIGGVVQVPTSGSCIPQFYCSGSTYYYRSSTCVDQMYQTCQYGCADSTTCAAAPGSATSSTTTRSQNTDQTSTSASTSTYDAISAYATTSTQAQTLAPITLNPGTTHATALQPQQTPQGIVYVPVNQIGNLPVQDTFTSSDLSGSLPQQVPQSGYSAILNNIQTILATMMSYLRPFGGVPAQTHFE